MDVEPFVFRDTVDPITGKCRDLVPKVDKTQFGVQVPCLKYNYTNNTVLEPQLFCCSGYCIDLLQKLSDRLNFTYELHISKDGTFGNAKSVRKIVKNCVFCCKIRKNFVYFPGKSEPFAV